MNQADEGGPRQNDFSVAREMFFRHDGSRFYMSRNDVDSAYLAYGVPKELERKWLGELTEQKLGLLQSPGNWWSIAFLLHHQDGRFLRDVLSARPLGVLWERIAFVEHQLKYVEMCFRIGPDARQPSTGVERVLNNARALLRSCRSDATRARVNQLIAKAERTRLVAERASRKLGQ
jgi:hypothetical protein